MPSSSNVDISFDDLTNTRDYLAISAVFLRTSKDDKNARNEKDARKHYTLNTATLYDKKGRPVSQLAEHRAPGRSRIQTPVGQTLRILRITEEKVLPLYVHVQMVRLSSLLFF